MAGVVYTAHRSYRGADRLDITLAAQDPVGRHFAPAPEDFRVFHARRVAGTATAADWEVYCAAYAAHMRASAQAHPEVWAELLARPRVTLVCACPRGVPCHRRELARMLVGLGASDGGERRIGKRGDARE